MRLGIWAGSGGLLLAAAAVAPLDPVPQDPPPCGPVVSEAAPHPDLYCLSLIPGSRVLGASGTAELRRIPGPFTVAVTADGRLRYDVAIRAEGLPDPSSLGPFDRYVAWAAPPTLYPVQRLGEVRPDERVELGTIDLNRFLLLVSAEAAGAEEPSGPFVLRAQSPSSRMQPADFLELVLGATPADSGRDGHEDHAAGDDPWSGVPMPEGITMLPALMRLRPAVTPWLPGEGWEGEIVDARPRELIRVADGDSISLDAVYVRRRVGDRELFGYGFNGQIPGPLIWVAEDARITVGFRNRIDWPTAIHWHGLRLDNRFDGVPGVTQDPVPPGGSFRYEIRFPDPGIYWYHPHHREDVQQDLGLAGNLMVRAADPDYYGPAHREEILMLDDVLLREDGWVPFGAERATHALMGRFGNVPLVNGEPDWSIDVDRGEVVRFFFTNVSNTRTFNLSFDGAPMKVVGTDVGNYEREAWIESLPIAPAERYTVHVRFPETGAYRLRNRVQGIDHIAGSFFPEDQVLGEVRVSGRAAHPDLGDAFEALRSHAAVTEEIDGLRPGLEGAVRKALELDMRATGLPLTVERLMQVDSSYFHPVEWSGTMPMMNLMATTDEVRWILRDPATGAENEGIEWSFRVGDLVHLRLRNRRETLHQMQHPIHIHGQRFLVLAVNGVPNDNLAWKDTAVVPVGATLDLLLEMSNPGRWMIHCHIAEHLEAGMHFVFTVDGGGGPEPDAPH